MKLIYCEKCQDVVRLDQGPVRKCKCRSVGGRYVDDLISAVYGDPIVLGVTWGSLIQAISYFRDTKGGRAYDPRLDLSAFVIPLESPRVKRFSTLKELSSFVTDKISEKVERL